MEEHHDYYQPYVMKTKHNDLKRLGMKYHSDFDLQSNKGKNDLFVPNPPMTQGNLATNNFINNQNNKPSDEHSIDILGNEL